MSHRLHRLALVITIAALAAGTAAAAEIHEFNDQEFQIARQTGQRMLVVVRSPWSPTNQELEDTLYRLAEDPSYTDVTVFELDYDRRKDVLRRLHLSHDRMVVAYRGSLERGRVSGLIDEMQLRRLMDATR